MPSETRAGVHAMEAHGVSKNPWVAGTLSGVLPGLGQFYNRQWGMGGGRMITETAMTGAQAMTARPASSAVGKLIVVGLLALAVGAFFSVDLKEYLSLRALRVNRASLLAYTEAHYTRSVMLVSLF